MTTLPHSLHDLFLSNIPSLVELPASIQNFTQLRRLGISDCKNLETLPTGINFAFLERLFLCECSRLRTFPDISTNIETLNVTRTGIEEVPCWIEKFLNLTRLLMNGCNKLQSVSLHISKLNLHTVDFSDCESLTKASWNDSSSVESLTTYNNYSKLPFLYDASSSFPNNLINCFDFNVDNQEYIHFPKYSKNMMLSGEQVPSYFIYRTTGTSLTNVPLIHTSPFPPLFRFMVCAVVDPIYSLRGYFTFSLHISCRFKDRLENHFDCPYGVNFIKREKGIHLVIFQCYFPLNEDHASLAEVKYDHMDVQIHLSNLDDTTSKLKEWGIRLSDEFLSPESGLDNEDTLPDVCEADEDNMVYETERSEESGDSDVETEISKKRIKTTQEDHKMSL